MIRDSYPVYQYVVPLAMEATVLANSYKFFILQMGSRTDTVSFDHLMPVHCPDPVPQQPPRQVRPLRPSKISGPGPIVPVSVQPAVL